MVGVVVGAGLGLEGSSARTLGKNGVWGDPTQGRGRDQAFVNAATGNLVIQNQDEVLLGRGPDAVVTRTYNSLGASTDDNGDNWRPGAARKVSGLTGTRNTAGSTVSFTDWDGSVTVYTYNTMLAKYASTVGDGARDTIQWYGTASGWIAANSWVRVDGSTQISESFADGSGGRITRSRDLDANTLTFTYGANGLVSQIATANGEITYYDYNGSLQLTQVRTSYTQGTAQTLKRVIYAYDASNRLSTVTIDLTPGDSNVTDNVKYVTTYTYDGASKRVARIAQSDGSQLDIAYDASQRVSTITQTVGTATRVTTFAYNAGTRTTTVTDALGQVTTLVYDTQNQLTQITAPSVGGVAQQMAYAYNAAGDITSMTDAAGRVTTNTYDSAGNPTLTRDSIGNTVKRTYGSRNQLLTEARYVVPDPDGAGAGQPATPLTSRYATIYGSRSIPPAA